MKIKEFLKNCAYCYYVYFVVCYEDQIIDTREIYDRGNFDDFIKAYGDEEIFTWAVENNDDDTHITLFLKKLIDKR
jgi:hypothetical protein